MKAKDFLQQGKFLNELIREQMNEIENTDQLISDMNTLIARMDKEEEPEDAKLSGSLRDVRHYEEMLQKKLAELIATKHELTEMIDRIPEAEYRLIIKKRYLDMMPWEDIAIDSNKQIRWVQVIHGRALERLQEVLDAAGK